MGEQAAERIGARDAAKAAIGYLDEMVGELPEVVSGLEQADEGWLVTLELLELPRVPHTTDVLGCYQVTIGPDGEPVSFRRIGRYHRGQVDEESP